MNIKKMIINKSEFQKFLQDFIIWNDKHGNNLVKV